MRIRKKISAPVIALGAVGLCAAGPAAAYAGGFGSGSGAQTVHVGANGSATVTAGSRMTVAASTGCGGHYSDTTIPSTIRVLRTATGQVDVVPFKQYVENVLPNEWYASWKPASLQAGAVAVKSFAWYWTNHSADRSSGGQCYDVTDSTSSQVYQPGSATAATNAAVDATWDVAMKRSGSVLQAHYCATDTACGAWVNGDWMSQWGSQDLATDGDSYSTILKNYYSGITLTGASGGGGGPTPPPSSGGKYYENVWTNAPSYRSTSTVSRAGTLNSGRNYFYCQQKGQEVSADGYNNDWWLKTDDDSGNSNVWVNAIYISTGSNNGSIPGVPTCPGGGGSPTAKIYKNVWQSASSYTSPTSMKTIGVLHAGSNYFYCQSKGSELNASGYQNDWWLKTDDDSGNSNVWVNAIFVSGGSNNGQIPGIPGC